MNGDYAPPYLLEFVHTSPFGIVRQEVQIQNSLLMDTPSTERRNVMPHQPQNVLLLEDITGPEKTRESVFQEITLSDFSSENGYYISKFLEYLSKGRVSIFYKEGEYFAYRIERDKVKFLDITEFVYAQMELVQLLLFWDCFFIVLVYLISLYFVKSSLKNLKKLTQYAQHLDLDHLSVPLRITGHHHDEIRVISDAFNASLERIHTQIVSLKDFIANASHELKTPLMMISTEIDIALKKKDYEERFVNIKAYVKRLSELLDTLSLITRLESTKGIEKKSIKLQEVVKEVVEGMEKKYPNKHISLEIEKGLVVQAHLSLLEIVLKNLIENACKYAGDKAKITVVGTATSLSVLDEGVGISSEHLGKIFERFWQLEKTEQEGHSFGLGLYLVKKIVQLHGWKIAVESEVGKGSKFVISLTPQ
jgi:signal transduction histidine kinase